MALASGMSIQIGRILLSLTVSSTTMGDCELGSSMRVLILISTGPASCAPSRLFGKKVNSDNRRIHRLGFIQISFAEIGTAASCFPSKSPYLRTLDQVNGTAFLDLMIGAGLWSRVGTLTGEDSYPI